jgi:acyl-coenzyme A synthetase/AMP-(fatty) acid ligase
MKFCVKNFKLSELPKKVDILDEIPKTKGGKIDRRMIK